MIEVIASEKALEMLVSAYIEGPARQTFSKLAFANKKGTICETFGEIKVIHHARDLDDSHDSIGAAKKMPEEGTTASPGAVPEASSHNFINRGSGSRPRPDSADPKTEVEKDNFKPDGLYVYTNPGKGRRRNVLLFPIEVKAQARLFELLKATDTLGEANPGQPPQPGMNLLYGALMQIYDYIIHDQKPLIIRHVNHR
ncbi:hypothetical protein E4U52_007493 [Claviceps spartinae]|nr:hypothetical protein E4U52_007493 [Claviceps spartinae]